MFNRTLDFSIPHVLRNEEEYLAALAEIDRLLDLDPPEGTNDFDYLEFLSVLVQAYESAEEPFADDLSAQELVDFMLEQKEMTRADLVDILGSKSRVSEFFNGKRDLSKNQIDALYRELGIPPEYLLRPST